MTQDSQKIILSKEEEKLIKIIRKIDFGEAFFCAKRRYKQLIPMDDGNGSCNSGSSSFKKKRKER